MSIVFLFLLHWHNAKKKDLTQGVFICKRMRLNEWYWQQYFQNWSHNDIAKIGCYSSISKISFTIALPKCFSHQHFQIEFINGNSKNECQNSIPKMSLPMALPKWYSYSKLTHNGTSKKNWHFHSEFNNTLPKQLSQQHFQNSFNNGIRDFHNSISKMSFTTVPN